jgi:hypothetical protein
MFRLFRCVRWFIFFLCSVVVSIPAVATDLMRFWDTPQHGANSFNRLPPDLAYFKALRGYGASWVRLSYDKWKPADRDFLLGNADRYTGLQAADVAVLKATLDRAHQAGLKVVIAPLSLPGARWKQNNGDRFDDRLWSDKAYWTQAAAFWRDLAAELRDHPAIAAYNLLNEPSPEFRSDLPEHADLVTARQWMRRNAGTSRDLPDFYDQIIASLRESDASTPVMVDAGWYAAADALAAWPHPLADGKVLYSVYMYEPYAATSGPNIKRKVPYPYPGQSPFGGRSERWDATRVSDYLQQPVEWAVVHGVPVSRLVVGEFGCMRLLSGCMQYLEDVLQFLDRRRLHWAFYSFREDNWDGMDYELGNARVPWAYWKAIEANQPDPLPRKATREFEPIRKRLQQN